MSLFLAKINRILILFLFFFSIFVKGQNTVTFQVNLSTIESFNPLIHQVYLSGANQNASAGIGGLPIWPMPGTQTAFLMMPNSSDANVYHLTIQNVEPGIYAYKYFIVTNNQPSWNLGEWSSTNNRLLMVFDDNIQTNDLFGVTANQEVNLKINEIMASNGSTYSDEDGDFEDWIEIFNAGSDPVNLYGFGLSDNLNNPFKWTFPSVFLNPNQYLIVWASGKNRRVFNQPFHTNFSLSSFGEPILLSNQNGEMLDEIPSLPHQNNVSLGRFPNASSNLVYFSIPTPNALNAEPGYASLSSPLSFSIPEGYYAQPLQVSISTPDSNTIIRYTLDGSEPKETSPIYTSAILMDDLSNVSNGISTIPTNFLTVGPPYFEGWQPPNGNVQKINVLRAKAFNNETPNAPSFTATYIIHPQLNNRYSLPVISLATDADNLFDNNTGVYVWGNFGNYFQNWERSCNFTYFKNDGTFGFNENAGFQLNGNTTRSRPRKAIRMIFKGEYGSSWLNYPVFEDKDTERYKRLILRNGGNDWGNSLIRDVLGQFLARDFNVETQFFQPTILFINGEYWGIHNLRDRYSTHYFETKYNIPESRLTVMENNAEFKRGNPSGVSHYQSLLNYLQNNDLSQELHFNEINQRMDVESFIDFQLANIYAKNTDWPGNNSIYWRYLRNDFDLEAGALDGRWRWVLFDLDFAFDLNLIYVPFLNEGAAHNTLSFALATNGPSWPNPSWSTFMLSKLTTNHAFKLKFINRYCDLLNTVYRPEFVLQTIENLKSQYEPEMQEHINRWRMPQSVQVWQNEISGIVNFTQNRAHFQFEHLQEVFQLGLKHQLTVGINNTNAGYVRLNSIDLKSTTNGIDEAVYPWHGYYLNGSPITLTAYAETGFVFSHWSGMISSTDSTISINLESATEVIANFVTTEIVEEELLNFWVFDNTLANDTALESISPTFNTGSAALNYTSCLSGYPFDANHPNWRKASLERRNAPTVLNYYSNGNNNTSFAQANIRGIQVKQPFHFDNAENAILLTISTVGYEDIRLKFAAKDEGAADGLIIDYQIPNQSTNFLTDNIMSNHSLSSDFELYSINFNDVLAANNADSFVVRIRFSGDNLFADQGNRVTFNNISVSGKSIPLNLNTIKPKQSLIIYPNPSSEYIHISSSENLKSIQFFDVFGQSVYELKTFDNNRIRINHMAQGVYIVRAFLENEEVKTGKLIVNRK